MIHGRASRILVIPFALALLAALAFAACNDGGEDAETPAVGETPVAVETPPTPTLLDVDVLATWSGSELESFEVMVAPWEASTGGEMDYVGTRDIATELSLNVEGGNPPDVAIPAELGLFRRFARSGELIPLSQCPGLEDTVRTSYAQGFVDLGTVDGILYGFFMKADTKATVWYNPGLFARNGYEPLTASSAFQDLIDLTNQIRDGGVVPPWSIGMENGAATGSPGTDWIQQILLNEAGPEVYDGVIDGSIPFTDDRVKDAWEKFGEIALAQGNTVQGGAPGINTTSFVDAAYPPFESTPTAAMTYAGGSARGLITDRFPDAVAGTDFDFFPWPGGAVTTSANIVYAFNGSETTCSFLSYLASAEAQRIWVGRGGFTSVNTDIGLDFYSDPLARAQAEQLLAADVFRFDLDDAIGGTLQQAYLAGITEYLADPAGLDDILAKLEAAREAESGE